MHPALSRRRAREAVEKGQVTVDGQVVWEPGRDVAEGARVVWDANRPARPRPRFSLPVLHVDDAVLVVDKPAGLLTVPSGPGRRDEDSVVVRLQEEAKGLGGRRAYVGLVHRLDRDTSGALAFARTPSARAALKALFRAHRIDRHYLALVGGEPARDAGDIDLPLAEAYEAGRRHVARPGEEAREALTRYRVRERFRGAALLEVRLETGRQHQVRVHLAHLGHPLLGDPVYGGTGRTPRSLAAPRQMLHAWRLGFDHPDGVGRVAVDAPLPPDFGRVLARLRAGRG